MTKQELYQTEKKFWVALKHHVHARNWDMQWKLLGNKTPWRRITSSMEQFHHDDTKYGFYGLSICLGTFNGYAVDFVIENQNEIIFGIQLTELKQFYQDDELEVMNDFIVKLQSSGKSWEFDAMGMLAWRKPAIHLDFRDPYNRSVSDMFVCQDDSEALIRLLEEVNELYDYIDSIIFTLQTTAYGTFIT